MASDTLPEFEKHDWHLTDSIKRIWEGEREWHALAEGLDHDEGLLILELLETLAQPRTLEEQEDADSSEQVLATIVAVTALAAQGDAEARVVVEEILPQLEAAGWHVAAPLRRVWAGERDRDALLEGLDEQDARLVGKVLEALATATRTRNLEEQ